MTIRRNSSLVPTMGLAEENAELRLKNVMLTLDFQYIGRVNEIAVALMMEKENIDDMDVADATWEAIGRMCRNRYTVQAERFIDKMKILDADNAEALTPAE